MNETPPRFITIQELKDMTELKPCPFCGGAAIQVGGGMVECSQCYANGGTFVHVLGEHNDPDKEAIEAWNRRVNE